tara:strand:- start:744 stop:962 length:219 start_codon:yes stop_codon:yes gene_type:complete
MDEQAENAPTVEELRFAAEQSRLSAGRAIRSAMKEAAGFRRADFLKAAANYLRDARKFAGEANMADLLGDDD